MDNLKPKKCTNNSCTIVFFVPNNQLHMLLICQTCQSKNNNMKILRLSLRKLPFDVMKTGEKKREFRKPSKWIMSRLVDKNGEPKHYDYVEFTNGYGADKPKFMVEYKGFEFSKTLLPTAYSYSNGLSVIVNNGDVIIKLGELYEKK